MLGERLNEKLEELARVEDRTVHTERLRAVGELAGGVSHNLNNILTGITLPIALLREETSDPEMLELIDILHVSAERAQMIVQRLNRSVRLQRPEAIGSIDLASSLQEALELTRSRRVDQADIDGVRIETLVEIPDDLDPVLANEGQLV